MLEIAYATPSDLRCIIEVDPYVPLSFKTYSDVLPGPLYYRIGNFRTSLLEIAVDPTSHLIRGICLVSCDRLAPPDERIQLRANHMESGLPTVSQDSLVGDRTDHQCEFTVALGSGTFLIDWGRADVADSVIRHERASFYIVDSKLYRIAFTDLSDHEVGILRQYLREQELGGSGGPD